jgi:two-component system, chemotaxis family, response regulator Rcp1
MRGRVFRLLIADDSPSDINLFKIALRNQAIDQEVFEVHDAAAAIDFLRRRGAHAKAPKVDLLVLDINMPKMTGHQVLAAVKADPDLRRLPVVMLTRSANECDVSTAYGLHANCYVQKPNDVDSWYAVVRSLEEFWTRNATLPANV